MYIEHHHQLKPGPVDLIDKKVTDWLVDELFRAAKRFRHTRRVGDLQHVINVAKQLNQLGFDLVWIPRTGCVGAHRRGALDACRQKPVHHTVGDNH